MLKKRSLILSVLGVVALTMLIIGIRFVLINRDVTENYGTLNGPISPKRSGNQQCRKMNREGLDSLHVHGSGMINYNDFMPDYKGDMSKVYVINLRPEETLYYYKNRCLLWYGLGYTEKNLGKTLGRRINYRIKKYFIRLVYGHPPIDDPSKLQTEKSIVRGLGAHYYSPLVNNINWVSDLSYMDGLIIFFKNLPDDAILYIHCLHGKGRTTTFQVLYDIFKNHKKVPLIDIINRHYCLGREDLFDTTIWETSFWTQEGLDARKKLAEQFYAYMTDPKGYSSQTWSQWHQDKNVDKTPIQIHRLESSVR